MARALLIIDFQNDFTAGGALAVPDGDAIAGRVNELIDSGDFDLVVATRDWHPPDHGSFREQGGPWPPALRAGHATAPSCTPRSTATRSTSSSTPATSPDLEGYSGFEETDLAEVLREPRRRRGHRRRAGDRLLRQGTRRSTPCARASASRSTAAGSAASTSSDGDSERALEELRAAGRDRELTCSSACSSSMFHWYRLVGRASDGARALERDGVVAAVVPAAPERAVVNAVVYRSADGARGRLRRGRRRLRRDRREVDRLGSTWRRHRRRAAREPWARARRRDRGRWRARSTAWSGRPRRRSATGPPRASLTDVGAINDRSYTFGTDSFSRALKRLPDGAAHVYVVQRRRRARRLPARPRPRAATARFRWSPWCLRRAAGGSPASCSRTRSPTPPSAATRPPR